MKRVEILLLVAVASIGVGRESKAQTWTQALSPPQIRNPKIEAPRPGDLQACSNPVIGGDSIALTRDAAFHLQVWTALGRAGVWDELKEIPPGEDTVRARIINIECGMAVPFALILQHGSYFFRLQAKAIPVADPREGDLVISPVFLIRTGGHLEGAAYTNPACSGCPFTLVSSKDYADSVRGADASALQAARLQALRAADERRRSEDLAAAAAIKEQAKRAAEVAESEKQVEKERAESEKQADRVRAERIRARHWPTSITNAVIARKIKLGMTREQVRAAWGEPDDIHRTVTAYVQSEQWVYGSQYVYFDHGVVTAWQD